MNTELFGAPLLALAMVAYAWLFEAPRDAETIAAGEDVHHTPAWMRRFLSWALASIVVFGFVMPHTWASVAACALVGYGAFTPVFRLRLNTLRGLDWRYVSPSNWYDFQFLWIFGGANRKQRALVIEHWTKDYHDHDIPLLDWTESLRSSVHRAGLLAYFTETAALSAGIWLYYHQL